jgi:acetyl-CoA decarbonylase/synthase complex subunit beta
VQNGKVEIVGPDLSELQQGGSYSLFLEIFVAGERLEKDMEPVIERRLHDFCNYIEGVYHMNQQDEIWYRISKDAYKRGLTSLQEIGEILIFEYTSDIELIEQMQVTFYTAPALVKGKVEMARSIYEERRARARGLKEEDVEEFYGCVLCQSFAPTHCCLITPERIANCGAISWFDGRAASKMDPEGPIFQVPKGETLSAFRGEYSGANETIQERSLGSVQQVWIHSAIEYPHTSCGCFQALYFYIPEVDAFGIVHRDYKGMTPLGVPFSAMAGEASGGRQVEGMCGMALEYMRSPKFFQYTGGMRRVVWMPKEVKERFEDVIPSEIYAKIATEEDATDPHALAEWLLQQGHPWITGEAQQALEQRIAKEDG